MLTPGMLSRLTGTGTTYPESSGGWWFLPARIPGAAGRLLPAGDGAAGAPRSVRRAAPKGAQENKRRNATARLFGGESCREREAPLDWIKHRREWILPQFSAVQLPLTQSSRTWKNRSNRCTCFFKSQWDVLLRFPTHHCQQVGKTPAIEAFPAMDLALSNPFPPPPCGRKGRKALRHRDPRPISSTGVSQAMSQFPPQTTRLAACQLQPDPSNAFLSKRAASGPSDGFPA